MSSETNKMSVHQLQENAERITASPAETLALVKLFTRIKDPDTRREIIQTVRAIADKLDACGYPFRR